LKYVALTLVLFLAGCASSGVVPLSDDLFVISKNTAKVGGGVSASAVADVVAEANDFCAKQSREMERADLKLTPGQMGALGNVTLQFRCK
jgi:hypothetical protein